VLGGKMSDFYDRIRGPMIATEVMGVTLFFLRLALEELLPSRVPLPFSSADMSEVTIVLIVGVAVGILIYFAMLRFVDSETYDGFVRTLRVVVHAGRSA
jgi:hypothetical protein